MCINMPIIVSYEAYKWPFRRIIFKPSPSFIGLNIIFVYVSFADPFEFICMNILISYWAGRELKSIDLKICITLYIVYCTLYIIGSVSIDILKINFSSILALYYIRFIIVKTVLLSQFWTSIHIFQIHFWYRKYSSDFQIACITNICIM